MHNILQLLAALWYVEVISGNTDNLKKETKS